MIEMSRAGKIRYQFSESGWYGSLARFGRRTYAADYVGLISLAFGFALIQVFVEPFHRMFSLDDHSISYPHATVERVSALQCVLYSVGGSLFCVVLWCVIGQFTLHKTHVTMLGLSTSILLTCLLTDIVKNVVGRPRPDLLSRCKPQTSTPRTELVTIDVCTETSHHILQDGWRSFPSGHSSLAFSGLGYLSLFMGGQLHTFRPGKDLMRFLIILTPLVFAGLIAASRLADYRHDVYDVVSGSALGIFIAYTSYRRYFRGLRDQTCHEPYPNPALLYNARTTERGDRHSIDVEMDGSYEEQASSLHHIRST